MPRSTTTAGSSGPQACPKSPPPAERPQGATVYLLHFERPYHHAKHYLHVTSDLAGRLADHAAGRGARLMEVITAAGIGFTLARTWDGTRRLERQLKNRHNSCRLCPICRAAKRAARPGRKDSGGNAGSVPSEPDEPW